MSHPLSHNTPFPLPHYVQLDTFHVEIFHIVNIDVLAGVSGALVDAQQLSDTILAPPKYHVHFRTHPLLAPPFCSQAY